MKRIEVCEMIQRRLAGGTPSSDFEPVLDEINAWLDPAVAQSALRNYSDSASIDMEFIADAYTATYKVPIVIDEATNYYKGNLPGVALAVPRGYDITSVSIFGAGYLSKPAIRVSPQQLDYFEDIPHPKDAIFFWPEGSQIFVKSRFDLTGKNLSVRMTGSYGKRKLTDDLLCPADYIPFVVEWVLEKFGRAVPKDEFKDGINEP